MAETEVYVDEDRALGFHVWVAELELLVGTTKGRQIDQVILNFIVFLFRGAKCQTLKMLCCQGGMLRVGNPSHS